MQGLAGHAQATVTLLGLVLTHALALGDLTRRLGRAEAGEKGFIPERQLIQDRVHATEQAVGHRGRGPPVRSVPTRSNALLRVFVSRQPVTGLPSCTWEVRTAHR